ncbi:hypothetical protein [Streptomyces sp. NPDC057939]|uniref:hypothetical protein n=1 Tax=Streptomyces sp. NPDC057939 TaxID=3346284 RepID=UPI0036F17E6A
MGWPGWDAAAGAEAVGAWQGLTVWALLLVLGDPAGFTAGSLLEPAVEAAAAGGAGFLHGLLLVRPVAALGRWGAGRGGGPEPVVVGVLLAPASAAVAVPVCWGLGSWAGGAAGAGPGFGAVWAWTAAAAVLPLLVGAFLRSWPVATGAVWRGGAVAAGTVVGVVTLAGALTELRF